MSELHPRVAEILNRLGINPDDYDDPPAFDLVAFRLEQAEKNLSRCPAMFENAKPTKRQTVTWVRNYLTAPSKAGSLLFSGPTGRGKTWEAWGILRACAEGQAAIGRACYFKAISHPDFNAAMRPGGDLSPEVVLDSLMDIDLLLLDDISAGNNTGWTGENLYRLVDHRWANCKPTIYSTNLPPNDLAQAVGARVLSRLASAEKVTFDGPDMRLAAA